MPKTVKYIGTQIRWPELAVTGKQSTWNPGHLESRSDVEAAQLLATGFFALAPTNPLIVVDSAAPVNADGLPDGTIYIQTV